MQLLPSLLLCLAQWASAELFSSIADLEGLLTAEKAAVDALNKYIDMEEKRLDDLSRLASRPVVSGVDMAELSNPIGSFHFIKAWLQSPLISTMRKNAAEDVLDSLRGMPDEGDLEGAAKGLVRLQLTYGISTKDLAYGYPLAGLGNGTVLSVSDCFEIGKLMYAAENYFYALEWLEEAWQKTMRSDHIDVAGKIDIMDYLSWAYQKTGNLQRAYWTAKTSLGMQGSAPDSHTQDNLHYFLTDLNEGSLPIPKSHGDVPPLTNIPPGKKDEMKLYDDLCVKETPPPVSSKLNCVLRRNHPYHYYAPVREEILSKDPPVSIYRDFITENEIEHLINKATPNLRRALVVDRTAGFQERPAEYRVAKNYWLRELHDDYVNGVNERIALTTGLDMGSAEFLQMANYGIAGQYEPHFDMSTEPENEDHDPYDDDLGNRIATVLIYFNTPAAGGGTVFGDLNLHVAATKGTEAI